VTVLDLYPHQLASTPVLVALVGASMLAMGLALRRARTSRSRRRPGGSAALNSRPPLSAARCAPAVISGGAPPALGAVEDLTDVLDRSRRLVAAEERVARELACADGWVVERYVLVGTRRVPFVLVGPSGVFALCATDGAWTLYDLEVLSRLGDELRDRLPGYRGRVEAVVCLAFDHAEPRAWYGGADRGGRGGWVLGVDQLLRWLSGWGPEHGLAAVDVSRIAVEAGPHWRRRSTARLPVRPGAG
jgi:hypothetical protein